MTVPAQHTEQPLDPRISFLRLFGTDVEGGGLWLSFLVKWWTTEAQVRLIEQSAPGGTTLRRRGICDA